MDELELRGMVRLESHLIFEQMRLEIKVRLKKLLLYPQKTLKFTPEFLLI